MNGLLKLDPMMRHFPALRVVVDGIDNGDGTNHVNGADHANNTNTPTCIYNALTLEQTASLTTVGDLTADLIELAYGDMRIAYKSPLLPLMTRRLWIDLFPRAWSSFSENERKDLTAGFAKFLASDSHSFHQSVSTYALWEELDKDYKQWGASTPLPFAAQASSCYGTLPVTNGLQAVLEALLRCSPQPRLPPTLLFQLAKQYGCGPQATVLLEQGMNEATDATERTTYRRCLKSVFVEVKRDYEVDGVAGDGRAGGDAERNSDPAAAQRHGAGAFRQAAGGGAGVSGGSAQPERGGESGRAGNTAGTVEGVRVQPEEVEGALRVRKDEPGLLGAAGLLREEQHLGVGVFPSVHRSQYQKLLYTSNLGVERELQQVRAYLLQEKYSIMQTIRRGTTRSRSRLGEVLQTNYRMLGYQPQAAHDALFHSFHQYYNLNLSQSLANQSSSMGVTEEMNSILKQMMGYMMNAWDPLSMWEDILVWRANVIMEYLRKLPPDAPHCVFTPSLCYVMLARAARYQNLPEVAQEYLNMTSGEASTLEGLDKWKERVNILLDLNCCDASVFSELEHFQLDTLKEPQKSSIHFIKGLYYQKEHKPEEAIGYFNRAIQTDAKNSKAWEAWTSILYSSWCERRDYNEAQRCINCCVKYLALNVDTYKVMPKLLHVIFTCLESQVPSSNLSAPLKLVPLFVWLPYLPFILSFPSESQLVVFQGVLRDLIQKYSQILFYPLHSLVLSLGMPNDNVYAKPTTLFSGTIGSIADSNRGDSSAMLSNALYFYHTLLNRVSLSPSQLLLFIDTLHLVPHDPYRELLASADRLLRSVYSEVATGGPQALASPVSTNLRQRLATLCTLQFNLDNALPSTMAFLAQFSTAFHQDFNPMAFEEPTKPNPLFPSSLQVLLQRLLLWKQLALFHIRGDTSPPGDLKQLFLPYSVDIPKTYSPMQDNHLFFNCILSIRSYVPALYREVHGSRYVEILDEQGSLHRFFLEQVNSIDSIIEERTLYFQIFFSLMLPSSQPAQMRHLTATLPSFVSISPTLRLVRSSPFATTLEGVYQEALGDRFDEKQLEFAMRLFFAEHGTQEAPEELRAWASRSESLLESVCPATLLSRFV